MLSGALWVLLLEKAFAKVYGSYAALANGAPYEALIDLTGLPAQCLRFDDASTLDMLADGRLWSLMKLFHAKGYIMSASTGKAAEEMSGLAAGYSFTILAVTETSTGMRLIKLHDPWCLLHWEGDWSRNSDLWNDKTRREVGAEQYLDTIVWISLEDCIKKLHCLNVLFCRRIGESTFIPYEERREPFTFTYNTRTSYVENPIYLMRPHNTGNYFLSVSQNDANAIGGKPYIDIGVTVLRKGVRRFFVESHIHFAT